MLKFIFALRLAEGLVVVSLASKQLFEVCLTIELAVHSGIVARLQGALALHTTEAPSVICCIFNFDLIHQIDSLGAHGTRVSLG